MKLWIAEYRRQVGLAFCVGWVGWTLSVVACRSDSDPAPDPTARSNPYPPAHKPAAHNPTAAEPAGRDRSATVSRSPAETVRHMHACRVSGKYAEMIDLLTLDRQQPVLELVRAVDELVAAESYLRETIRSRVGEGSAEAFTARAQVANILGSLSQTVRVVDETVDGETAKVMIQVADRIPLEAVNLTRIAGTWRVVTDKPIKGLPNELRKLAEADRRVARELLRRPLTSEDVERELAFRHGAILQRIVRLTEDATQDEGENPTKANPAKADPAP